jgi:DNA mismatch repair protein MutL
MHDTFVVLETDEGIAVIDQHALHERILFDRLKARLGEGTLPSQGLLAPVVVELEAPDVALVEERAELLRQIGFVAEPFGPGAIAVRGVPQATRSVDPGRLFVEVVSLLREDDSGGTLDRVTDELCDLLACKAAVKAGDPLPPEQIRALLGEGDALVHQHSCPHGRPTTLVITREDLERYFQRR